MKSMLVVPLTALIVISSASSQDPAATKSTQLSGKLRVDGKATETCHVASITQEQLPDDTDQHPTIYLSLRFSLDEFFALVTALETEFRITDVGEVSGTGWTLNDTWSEDVSGASANKYIGVAEKFLSSRKIEHRIEERG